VLLDSPIYHLFIAVNGVYVDGHDYIDQAIDAGATTILCQNLPDKMMDGITYVKCKNTSDALADVAGNWFEHPSSNIKVIFCDTNWEKQSTYEELKSIKQNLKPYGIEFIVLKNDKYPNGMSDLILDKKMFPSRDYKFCTEQLKMIPATNYYKTLYKKGFDVVCLVGKRRDESLARAKTPDIEIKTFKDWHYTVLHPIASWSETDVYSLLFDEKHNGCDIKVSPLCCHRDRPLPVFL